MPRRVSELHPLDKSDSEDEDFISCKKLSHAIPFANSERDEFFMLDEP